MTGPIRGVFTLRCNSCQAVVYSSDQGPPADRMAELVRFADTQCPRGGTLGGCPNTSTAVAEQSEIRPPALRDRAPRTRRVVLPALVANASSPVEVTVTWRRPMADTRYSVFARTIVPAELLGKIDAAVKIGSLTPEGCVVLVAASSDTDRGDAQIHVMGVPRWL